MSYARLPVKLCEDEISKVIELPVNYFKRWEIEISSSLELLLVDWTF